ncbi:MAG: hypoxanthine phosphoribosyltransferase [Oscillospiraceae bacterium]|nr:hypoxanthine phosphoribosyltransferase [Oscillospiraceae bacterium]MBR3963710.1 hypoxanthine phosphoribosyltransferase [Oscillospiraceae bacterium]MBR6657350.1 hypoxanthine phosphoribosyltransferase [Oscillospiraceae bacterium]
MHTIEEDIERILISEKDIKKAVKKMGKQISKDYEGKNLFLVAVLKGSIIFMGDLMRAISIPLNIDFMSVSSYGGGTKSSGVVKIIKDLDHDLSGKDILIVEDILDSGMTLSYLKKILSQRNVASIRIATLLDKPERRIADVAADYFCFTVPDEFVVGYGLDYDQQYRHLPYIGVLKPEIYEK